MAQHAPRLTNKSTGRTRSTTAKRKVLQSITDEERENMIQVVAYHIAERRKFENGDPVQDWLQAETQVTQLLNAR